MIYSPTEQQNTGPRDNHINNCSSPCVDICETGKYSEYSSGATTCKECIAGKYLPTGTKNCVECEDGKFSDQGESSCETCEPGRYSNNMPLNIECISCPTGFHQNNSESDHCTVCPLGFSVGNIVRHYFEN